MYEEAALDAWLAAQDDLQPPVRVDASTFPVDLDERITLWRFAEIIGKNSKTVNQHRTRPGFPEAGPDGKYRAGDLLDYWNNRPGRRTQAQLPAARRAGRCTSERNARRSAARYCNSELSTGGIQ
jgi:hypothetical protein